MKANIPAGAAFLALCGMIGLFLEPQMPEPLIWAGFAVLVLFSVGMEVVVYLNRVSGAK